MHIQSLYLLNLFSVPQFSDETLHLAVFCSSQVLKVTIGVPEDEQVSLIGPEFKGKNKWQNGFLGRDNAVYGLPCNAETVLRISEDDVRISSRP